MNIRRVLGIKDHGVEDILDMVLSERLSAVKIVRTQEQQERLAERDRLLRNMVREHYPDNATERENALDMIAMCESEETEDAYLCGIRDGMRLQKVIDQI